MIGEIYLMYGSDGKLILEYSWDGDSNENAGRQEKRVAGKVLGLGLVMLTFVVQTANFLEMWNDSYEESWEMKQRNLTSSLSKLLSLAKLHYRPNSGKVGDLVLIIRNSISGNLDFSVRAGMFATINP